MLMSGRFLPDTNIVIALFADEAIVKDNLGMTETVKNRIFRPFFTTKPNGKGTGLGLAISHQIIVEKHQGQLLCQSTPGQGTEFTIKIPMAQ
jgi:two-component system NtrC family sensor kinase